MRDGFYTVVLDAREWGVVVDQLAEGSVKRMSLLIQKIQRQIQEQVKENIDGTGAGTRRAEAGETVGSPHRY